MKAEIEKLIRGGAEVAMRDNNVALDYFIKRLRQILDDDPTRSIVIHDDGSFWYGARRLPKFIESDIRVWLEADDAQGGTDEG